MACGRDYLDGEECTEIFDLLDGKPVPESWLDSNNVDDARLLIHTVLGFDGLPCDWSADGERRMIAFQGEVDGLGYEMEYIAGKPDGFGFADVIDVHVYRAYGHDGQDGERFVPFEIAYHGDVC